MKFKKNVMGLVFGVCFLGASYCALQGYVRLSEQTNDILLLVTDKHGVDPNCHADKDFLNTSVSKVDATVGDVRSSEDLLGYDEPCDGY